MTNKTRLNLQPDEPIADTLLEDIAGTLRAAAAEFGILDTLPADQRLDAALIQHFREMRAERDVLADENRELKSCINHLITVAQRDLAAVEAMYSEPGA